MQVVILAGGLGTRLGELTERIPKPMVKVGKYPIIIEIMRHYLKYGANNFILCLGYRQEVVRDYFSNFQLFNSDISLNSDGSSNILSRDTSLDNCSITLADTGLNTSTAFRIHQIKKYLDPSLPFHLTYGDGLSNVNLEHLSASHLKSGCACTVTAVRPSARFGEITTNKRSLVTAFEEKPAINSSWVNGGFFVCNHSVFNYLNSDPDVMWEDTPLSTMSREHQLNAYFHSGYWRCMDTQRDRNQILDDISMGLHL